MWRLAGNPFSSACFPDGPLPQGPLDTEKDDDAGSAAADAPPPTLRTHWWVPPVSGIDSLVQRGQEAAGPQRSQGAYSPTSVVERPETMDRLTVIACWGLI